MDRPVFLSQPSVICNLGANYEETKTLLFSAQPQPMFSEFTLGSTLSFPSGRIHSPLVDCTFLPREMQSRNNALCLTALQPLMTAIAQAKSVYGAHRIGIIIGTSTSGIEEGVQALLELQHATFPSHYHYKQQEMGNVANMLAHVLGVTGPNYVISTACSSSAKALMSAARLVNLGICDVVIAGGVDTLSRFTVAGFHALKALSQQYAIPFSANRQGINIGEAAALFILSKKDTAVSLAGWGESADAYHVSAPDPQGTGAIRAMQAALQSADISAEQIDYINLHGTATRHNDAMESKAVAQIFGHKTYVSSTKSMTGHTLAAAGALEAALCYAIITADNLQGQLPMHVWDNIPDPQLPLLRFVPPAYKLGYRPRYVLSNSFGFGGSNASLVLKAE
jgi:3-oxoacyl-[acyl-carrier-protein] synthase-1